MIDDHVYEVGVGRSDITPPVGIRLAGYTVREGFSRGVHAPLNVTALVVRGSGSGSGSGGGGGGGAVGMVALLAVDVVVFWESHGTEIRRACAEALGIPPSHVLCNANHSHSTPMPGNYLPYDTPDQVAMHKAQDDRVLQGCVAACKQAAARLAPARMGIGWGECYGNINRRQKAPDGMVLLGEDPSGPTDHSVGVVRFDDLQGRPLAVVFRYSCHTVTLGPRTNVISPDYIAPARELIERSLGCPSMFLQGCAGNQNPTSGIGQDTEDNTEETTRLGHRVGGEVLKVAQGLQMHRRRKEPRLVHSVAVYWLYEMEPVAPGPVGPVMARTVDMTLPLALFPPLADVERERGEWSDRLASLKSQNAREWDLRVALRFDWWARLRLEAARKGPNPLPVTFPVQAIRIGPWAVTAVPFETMAETGNELRAAAPLPDTFVLGYSNGMVSYLPTPRVSSEGGMESKLAYKSYLVPSEVPGDWEAPIRQKMLDLLKEVCA